MGEKSFAEVGSERKSRLQWIFCYRAEDETRGGVDLRSSRTGVDPSSAYLLPWEERSFGLAGEIGVWGKATSRGRKARRRKICVLNRRWDAAKGVLFQSWV